MKRTVEKGFIDISGHSIPVRIYSEWRANTRASIGQKAAILRLPKLLLPDERKRQINWFKDWLVARFAENKALQSRFFRRMYAHGDTLQVGNRQYHIYLDYGPRKSHAGRQQQANLYLSLNEADSKAGQQKATQHLLSRLIAKDFLPEVSARVHTFHAQHFAKAKPFKSVKLKYNLSNWGSCSSTGNINLSTRLLFAPSIVQDYVIIHELAHLVEMNHSSRFWALVAKAMPDYSTHEQWLKAHNHLCYF